MVPFSFLSLAIPRLYPSRTMYTTPTPISTPPPVFLLEQLSVSLCLSSALLYYLNNTELAQTDQGSSHRWKRVLSHSRSPPPPGTGSGHRCVCVSTEHISPTLQHQEETQREGHHHGYQAAASLFPREGGLPSGQGVGRSRGKPFPILRTSIEEGSAVEVIRRLAG